METRPKGCSGGPERVVSCLFALGQAYKTEFDNTVIGPYTFAILCKLTHHLAI